MIVGFMGVWIDSSSDGHMTTTLIAAAVSWSLIVRPSMEVPWNILEELWSHNLVNLFASPLSIFEWMISACWYTAFSFVALLFFLWLCVLALFSYNIFSIGWLLVPLLCNYYLSALCIGFLTAALLIRYGLRMTSYVFMISWMFAPLSGIYYSLTVLPVWAQHIAHLLPTYYGVDLLKGLALSGTISYERLAITFALNGLYLVLTAVLFKWAFEQSRKEGLGRLVH